jgi:hypothetical protein
MKAVVILGAGSSADFGIPTLAGIFKDASVLRYLQRNQALLTQLQQVFWTPRGYSLRTAGESLTVEEMLTILTDWEREPKAGNKPTHNELSAFKKNLYILIQQAVYEGKSSQAGFLNPLIRYMRMNTTLTTWASFNWDCIFEASYWYQNSAPAGDFRAGTNPKLAIWIEGWHSTNRRDELLKLHGSIGWWMEHDKLTYLPFSANGPLVKKWRKYSENPEGDDYPVILEPSAYKYGDKCYNILEPQWARFVDRLLDADYVLVVGYSLPDLDFQARSKIITCFQSNERAKWLIVDPSAEVLLKYNRLLGRSRVTTYAATLTGFNNDLELNMERGLTDFPF